MDSVITEFNVFSGKVADNIVFSLQSEDDQIFIKLYDQFSSALYGLLIKWVKDKALAETILENVFINAWHNRKDYNRKKERIFTWLYRIARNIATHYIKCNE